MVNYACAFSQSELGKYFEWIITLNIAPSGNFMVEETFPQMFKPH